MANHQNTGHRKMLPDVVFLVADDRCRELEGLKVEFRAELRLCASSVLESIKFIQICQSVS